MNLPFDTEIPTSFDPAIHLYSRLSDDACAYEDLSTDLLELNQHLESTRKKKNRAGVVQHRAWKVSDVFRSEEDSPIGNLPASASSLSRVNIRQARPARALESPQPLRRQHCHRPPLWRPWISRLLLWCIQRCHHQRLPTCQTREGS